MDTSVMGGDWHLKVSSNQVVVTTKQSSDVVKELKPSKTQTGVMEVYTPKEHLQLHLSNVQLDCAQSKHYFEGKRKSRTLFHEAWMELEKQLNLEKTDPQAKSMEKSLSTNMTAETNTSAEMNTTDECKTNAPAELQNNIPNSSTSHESLKKHLYDDIIEVPVACLVEPSSSRLLRMAEERHVAELKLEMLANKMKTALLIGHLPHVHKEDVEADKLRAGKERIEILAGNHRRLALEDITKETSDDFYKTWPIVLYTGLSQQQALNVSYRENQMMNSVKPTTLQDETKLFRQRLQLVTTLSTATSTSLGRKEKEKWYDDIRAITGYKNNSEVNSKARIQTSLAKSSAAVWERLETVFVLWGTGGLKGNSKTRSIPQSVFKPFYMMKEEDKLRVLDMLIAKTWSITDFISNCRGINKKCDLMTEDEPQISTPVNNKVCHACNSYKDELQVNKATIQDLESEIRTLKRRLETKEQTAVEIPKKILHCTEENTDEICIDDEAKDVNGHRPKEGDLVVLDWGGGQIFMGLVTQSGEVMSTRQSVSKYKKEINEGAVPKGLLQLNPRDVNQANWEFLVAVMLSDCFSITETSISIMKKDKFLHKLQNIQK